MLVLLFIKNIHMFSCLCSLSNACRTKEVVASVHPPCCWRSLVLLDLPSCLFSQQSFKTQLN